MIEHQIACAADNVRAEVAGDIIDVIHNADPKVMAKKQKAIDALVALRVALKTSASKYARVK